MNAVDNANTNELQERISVNNTELADKLRTIRANQKPRISQTDFYRKYLLQLNLIDSNNPKEASIQNYMKRLENGMLEVPAVCLPVYASLAGCSVDYLLTGKNHSDNSNLLEEITARDICQLIVFLFENNNYNARIHEIEVKEDVSFIEGEETRTETVQRRYNALYFSNALHSLCKGAKISLGERYEIINPSAEKINSFLKQYCKLKDAEKSGLLPSDLYDATLEGLLQRVY